MMVILLTPVALVALNTLDTLITLINLVTLDTLITLITLVILVTLVTLVILVTMVTPLFLQGRVYHCFGIFEGEQGLCHTHIFRNSCTDIFVLNYLNHKSYSSLFSWTSFSLSVDFLEKRDRLAICGPSAFGRHFLQFSHFQQQRRHLDLNLCCI